MHGLRLLGRQARPDPHEAAIRIGQLGGQALLVQIGKDLGQFARGAGAVDHVAQFGIERVGHQIGGQQAAVAIQNVGTTLGDLFALKGLGLDHRRCSQLPHSRGDQREAGKKGHGEEKQPPFGPFATGIARLLSAQTQIVAFDPLRAFAVLAGVQNARQGPERGANHWSAPGWSRS